MQATVLTTTGICTAHASHEEKVECREDPARQVRRGRVENPQGLRRVPDERRPRVVPAGLPLLVAVDVQRALAELAD